MSIKIPVGIESFAKMREGGFYYIDKTSFIKELLSQEFEANLVTRPRRFGKTLTMSMLEDFFDIGRDSKAHFDELAISEETALCDEWQNRWPVVSLTLKSVEGLNFQKAYRRLKVLIANVCKKYAFLGESDQVDDDDKVLFKKLKAQEADEENLTDSLLILSRMMTAHYGKPAILLVDEYDVPLAKAHEHDYYTEMLDIIRALLGAALKTNPYLKFGVVTGCLKISKESIFTGVNNLVANTITVNRFDEGIGFTEPEVLALLSAAGFSDHAEEVRTWYDGYSFGSVDVYCPWDVLNHVAALITDPMTAPRSYWEDTSSNDVIYKLFENETIDVNSRFELLLSGGCIRETITEDLTYDSLEASEESLWSLLFMTGYLTQSKEEEIKNLPGRKTADGYEMTEKAAVLRIPNEEIKGIFRESVVEWFKKSIQTVDRSEMFKALWNGDTETAENAISDLLFAAISYNDYKESFYHAFVAGLFAGAGYVVESNREYGNGRPDVVIKEKRKRRVMVFEAKHADENETLSHALKEAVNQIFDKRYAEPFIKEGYRTVICYGIAFKGKDCMLEQCKGSE